MSDESAPSPPAPPLRQTDRTRIRRKPQRGSYARADAHAILDEGLVAHVAIEDDGQPFVLPMVYARIDDTLYLHGSPGSRLLRALVSGAPCAVSVTLVDGLVFARSALRHSMNYRALVVLGVAREVTEPDEKDRALAAFVDHVSPGRSAVARRPSPRESDATCVVALPLDEASVKTRTGGPADLPEDLDLPVWAGVVPLCLARGDPRVEPGVPPHAEPPTPHDRDRRHG